MTNEQIDAAMETTKTWIATDFGNVGIVGWEDFDHEDTIAVMEAMIMEKADADEEAAAKVDLKAGVLLVRFYVADRIEQLDAEVREADQKGKLTKLERCERNSAAGAAAELRSLMGSMKKPASMEEWVKVRGVTLSQVHYTEGNY